MTGVNRNDEGNGCAVVEWLLRGELYAATPVIEIFVSKMC
jgi:hypothetical protein